MEENIEDFFYPGIEYDSFFENHLEKEFDFRHTRNQVAKSFLLDMLFDLFHDGWDTFEDFKDVYRTLPVPNVAHDWDSDHRFAIEKIQGASCMLIKAITQLPPNFKVKHEDVSWALREGESLESELANHRMFLLDYGKYEGLSIKTEAGFCYPFALFYVNQDNKFIPLAIQLHQYRENPKANPVYTPKDQTDWLFAKMWVNCVDLSIFQLDSHFLRTHILTESAVIASSRCLSPNHPVYKLLRPHFKYQLAINTLARETLISPTGILVEASPLLYQGIFETAQKGYAHLTFDQTSFHGDLQSRGFPTDQILLPEYYYVTDGKKLWEAMETMVRDLLGLFYTSDQDVKNDLELQLFCEEYRQNGLIYEKGFPSSIDSLPILTRVLTSIIWTCSVTHSMLNYSQYDSFGFLPFSPGMLSRKSPGELNEDVVKGKLTTEDIVKSLPPKAIGARQIAVAYLLSQYSSAEDRLGDYSEPLFVEKESLEVLGSFKKTLLQIENEIKARAEWDHLLPSRLTSSTAI